MCSLCATQTAVLCWCVKWKNPTFRGRGGLNLLTPLLLRPSQKAADIRGHSCLPLYYYVVMFVRLSLTIKGYLLTYLLTYSGSTPFTLGNPPPRTSVQYDSNKLQCDGHGSHCRLAGQAFLIPYCTDNCEFVTIERKLSINQPITYYAKRQHI